MLFYERHDAAPAAAGAAAALPPLFIDVPNVGLAPALALPPAGAAAVGPSPPLEPALALPPAGAAAVGPSPALEPALALVLPPAVLEFFRPGTGLSYTDAEFKQRMSRCGRDSDNVARIPYLGHFITAEFFRTLRHATYVSNFVLSFIALAMQAENVALCAASPPAPFNPEHPALGPHGPTRLARVLMITSTSPPFPRAGVEGVWDRSHFVDLRLVDVVCKLHNLNRDHFAAFKLDLWGRALHVYDSIKLKHGGFARPEAKLVANDMLSWAATLGKLLDIPELCDASTWPVHWYDGENSAGMPRQGRPIASRLSGLKWDTGVDCALFTGSAAACAAFGRSFAFIQAHMPDLRKQAAYMIVNWWQSKGEEIGVVAPPPT